jgi:ComEC/Rec2-related protein
MLILFCLSLVLGAVLFHSCSLSLLEVGIVSVLYGALFCLALKNKKSLILGLVLAFTLVLGALRMWILPSFDIQIGKQAFTGVIKSVDERLDKTLLVIKKDNEDVDIQSTIYNKTQLLPGDIVSVRGEVKLPEDFLTDTGRTFDYDQFLSSRGVEAVMRRPQIVFISFGGFSFNKIATQIRFWLADILSSYITFPVDGIVAGMLVGFQGGIPAYLSDIFRNTGTLHTLVLSGYNVTVLAGFLGLIFRKLPFKIKTILTATGIVGLVLVSGAGIAAVRAGIMGCIALFASANLQNYQALRALFLSILFFFFVSPISIFVDPGLHLSFLATLFIITILPILKEKFLFIPNGKLNFRELIILAVGLPIFMLPYMMYFSGLFPVVSPIANIFLVPVIPILMLGGLVTILFSFIPFLANIVGGVTSFVGLISIKVLTFFSSFPQWQTLFRAGVYYFFI